MSATMDFPAASRRLVAVPIELAPSSLAEPHRFAPDPEPAQRMREELAAMRADGLSFPDAWSRAKLRVLRELDLPGHPAKVNRLQWLEAFNSTRNAWHNAYEGLPDQFSELARLDPDAL